VDLAAQIASIPMFEGLDASQHANLARIALEKEFSKGEVIFSEGEDAAGLYAVSIGRVKIYKLSREGKEQILHLFGPGESFGEVPVFAGGRFPAYAEALEPTRVLFFPRQAFVDLVKRDSSLALNMLADLSRRLRRFTSLIEDLSLKEVPGRLAAHLLYLSSRQGESDDLVLDLSKTQLASLLGTIPETLSRILARMAREGYIELRNNRQIRILDRESLELLASGETRLS